MGKTRIATVWLDGCSGCHMSFLDMDERLLAVADRIDLVYSPLVDAKVFPENVDLTIVEGAVSMVRDCIAQLRPGQPLRRTVREFGTVGRVRHGLGVGLLAPVPCEQLP